MMPLRAGTAASMCWVVPANEADAERLVGRVRCLSRRCQLCNKMHASAQLSTESLQFDKSYVGYTPTAPQLRRILSRHTHRVAARAALISCNATPSTHGLVVSSFIILKDISMLQPCLQHTSPGPAKNNDGACTHHISQNCLERKQRSCNITMEPNR